MWQQVLVIPAYRESASFLQSLCESLRNSGQTLIIVVLNRPAHDPDSEANRALRKAIESLPGSDDLRSLDQNLDIFCLDLERSVGPTPSHQGVGLARKTGCDLALKWITEGVIDTQWIGSTDADAILPADYFSRLADVPEPAVAAVYPFQHIPGTNDACNLATAIYELRMHHFVLGLEYAGSPYAYHSLGSSLAVSAQAYAKVRGFPRRPGAEDFYLLNKLRKLGPVHRLAGKAIALQSRDSDRVPFGTGPQVTKILDSGKFERQAMFYHPAVFDALGALLSIMPELKNQPVSQLTELMVQRGLPSPLAQTCAASMQDMGLEDAVEHCRRHSSGQQQFSRHFHQWFDAFRTLKLVHGIRSAGWPDVDLQSILARSTGLWPSADNVEELRDAVRTRWKWEIA